MSPAPIQSIETPRTLELVQRFRVIGETAMRDLPLYNEALDVEAVGFRSSQEGWIGVLITPWFMNLIRLPEPRADMDLPRIGRKTKLVLPSGERELVQGGDEVVGAYEALSLHSPMFAFETQEAARLEAEKCLGELMRPAPKSAPDGTGRLRAEPDKLSRRAFLRGDGAGTPNLPLPGGRGSG